MNLKNNIYFWVCIPFLVSSALFLHSFTYAQVDCFIETDDKRLLRKALEDCEEESAKNKEALQQQQSERTKTEKALQIITSNINSAEKEIRQSDIAIGGLSNEIRGKEQYIDELNEEIDSQQSAIHALLQRINEDEQRGVLSLLLSEASISSFFANAQSYTSLREDLEDSIERVDLLKDKLNANVEVLTGKKETQTEIRRQQEAAKQQIAYQQNEQQKILAVQKQIEDKIENVLQIQEKRIVQIQNRLFEFRGGGAIPFGEAVKIAEMTNRLTGIRPAFLLGLIKHESDLGKNVGKGSWRIDMHPTRDQPIFPYITATLGFEPDDVRVSARPGFGWGGAMGPAQFIPSTWVCYGGFVHKETGRCNRWSNRIIRGNTNLKIGSTGSDVLRLQQFLNANGFTVSSSGPGSPGQETRTYGTKVAQAVTKFQEAYYTRILRPYRLTKGTGEVGPSTRAAINELDFFSGPWIYKSSKDRIRDLTGSSTPSNPWKPVDALTASAIYLTELGAVENECTAARRYYAGGNWRSTVALNYCRAVLANAASFQTDIDYLQR